LRCLRYVYVVRSHVSRLHFALRSRFRSFVYVYVCWGWVGFTFGWIFVPRLFTHHGCLLQFTCRGSTWVTAGCSVHSSVLVVRSFVGFVVGFRLFVYRLFTFVVVGYVYVHRLVHSCRSRLVAPRLVALQLTYGLGYRLRLVTFTFTVTFIRLVAVYTFVLFVCSFVVTFSLRLSLLLLRFVTFRFTFVSPFRFYVYVSFDRFVVVTFDLFTFLLGFVCTFGCVGSSRSFPFVCSRLFTFVSLRCSFVTFPRSVTFVTLWLVVGLVTFGWFVCLVRLLRYRWVGLVRSWLFPRIFVWLFVRLVTFVDCWFVCCWILRWLLRCYVCLICSFVRSFVGCYSLV